MKYLSLLLVAVLLAGCATPATYQSPINAERTSPNRYESMRVVVDGSSEIRMVPTPLPPAPPPQPGISGWDVLGAAVLFPLMLPVAMITSYPSYGGVHCRSFVYKDELNTKCY
jgi:hypothetical protein